MYLICICVGSHTHTLFMLKAEGHIGYPTLSFLSYSFERRSLVESRAHLVASKSQRLLFLHSRSVGLAVTVYSHSVQSRCTVTSRLCMGS